MLTDENRILILNFFISSLKSYSYWFYNNLTNCNQLQELSEEKLSWFSENKPSKCVCANKVLVKFFEQFVLLILKTLVWSKFRFKASRVNWTLHSVEIKYWKRFQMRNETMQTSNDLNWKPQCIFVITLQNSASSCFVV